MRLVAAHIRNFKLLEDVRLEFSNSRDKPLTVIRAENGSGKTSVLYALLWGIYGPPGLPSGAQNVRLTSSAAKVGVPVEIQVVVEFERVDEMGTTTYQVIRTMMETPKGDDLFDRDLDKLRLLRKTPAGLEDVPGDPSAVIAKFLPPRLKSVFFTDGDDVQRFISGEGPQGRQIKVHDAIRALLGLDTMRTAGEDLVTVVAKCRLEAAKSAGANLVLLEERLAELTEQMGGIQKELSVVRARRHSITVDRDAALKELAGLRSIGDIDAINAQIKSLETTLADLEKSEQTNLEDMKLATSSQGAAWALGGQKLLAGFDVLDKLAGRGIIPGASLEVLVDRLELKLCICDANISEGTSARQSVERLLAEQRTVSEHRGHQTQTFHSARLGKEEYLANCDSERDFTSLRKRQLAAFAGNRDRIKQIGSELDVLREKRSSIDDELVRRLSDRVNNAQAKLTTESESVGRLETEFAALSERRTLAKTKYEEAENATKVNRLLATKRLVAEDLKDLITRTLQELEVEHVKKVSIRMGELFLSIVGTDTTQVGAVFKGVTLTANFDIEIQGAGGGTLDPDFEVNGASKRALTLSFIWALMEVSAQVAPRIIDTPLGMTSGGVKQRMVEAITRPPTATSADYQVVLFLTRSEIAGIESLIDDCAEKSQTLSCNNHYPVDLVNNWNVDHPLVRVCRCTVRQNCRVCERRYDGDHSLVARGE